VPYSADYIVACNNTDAGKNVRKYCKVGCIACKLCEKKSPDGGYVVENNLSRIDYSYTGDRSAGAEKCPPKCIVQVGESLQREAAPVESQNAAEGDASVAVGERPDRDSDEKS
jgi:Pyruvate/2-oxoacid:ferredoxin oxidoreductase delta subunit